MMIASRKQLAGLAACAASFSQDRDQVLPRTEQQMHPFSASMISSCASNLPGE